MELNGITYSSEIHAYVLTDLGFSTGYYKNKRKKPVLCCKEVSDQQICSKPGPERLELSVNTYCGVFQASRWGGAPMYQRHCGTYPNTFTVPAVLLDLRWQ